MTEGVGPDQAAANEELSPAERLAVMQNQLLVQRLKKEKLRLKESIERLKDEIIPDLNA